MELLIIYLIGAVIYFIPSIVGWKTKYASGILILNIFLGWTILGWIGALIWAVSAPKLNNKNTFTGLKPQNNLQNQFSAFLDIVLMRNTKPINTLSEVDLLLNKLQDGEAIIKNKLTNNYEIVTADNWEKIIEQNKQDDYEIIEEK